MLILKHGFGEDANGKKVLLLDKKTANVQQATAQSQSFITFFSGFTQEIKKKQRIDLSESPDEDTDTEAAVAVTPVALALLRQLLLLTMQ